MVGDAGSRRTRLRPGRTGTGLSDVFSVGVGSRTRGARRDATDSGAAATAHGAPAAGRGYWRILRYPGRDDDRGARRAPIDQKTVIGNSNLRAELAQPLIVGGQTYAEAGAAAYLTFTQDMDATRRQRKPIYGVLLNGIMIRNVLVPVQGADPSSAGVATRGPVVIVPAGTILTFTTK